MENDPTRESQGAKLNLGAIVALGAFGGFVFLAAVITTIVILVRRLVAFYLFNLNLQVALEILAYDKRISFVQKIWHFGTYFF